MEKSGHTCPKDLVIGARDFSPDWKHRYFGTEVPCPDNDKHQFIEISTQTLGHVWKKRAQQLLRPLVRGEGRKKLYSHSMDAGGLVLTS